MRRSFTPPLSGAGLARASNTHCSRSAHSGVSSPRTLAEPSGRGRRVRSRLRSRSFGSSNDPSGFSRLCMCCAALSRLAGSRVRAKPTRSRSTGPLCSGCSAAGSASTARRITRACSAEISPATWAAATSRKIGSSGSPVNAHRGPAASAARTRARASPGWSRRTWPSSTAIDAAPSECGRHRVCASAISPCPTATSRRESRSTSRNDASKSSSVGMVRSAANKSSTSECAPASVTAGASTWSVSLIGTILEAGSDSFGVVHNPKTNESSSRPRGDPATRPASTETPPPLPLSRTQAARDATRNASSQQRTSSSLPHSLTQAERDSTRERQSAEAPTTSLLMISLSEAR